jgi:hypothetical protein
VAVLLQGASYSNLLSSELLVRRVRCLSWDCPSYDPSFPVSRFKLYRSPDAGVRVAAFGPL